MIMNKPDKGIPAIENFDDFDGFDDPPSRPHFSEVQRPRTSTNESIIRTIAPSEISEVDINMLPKITTLPGQARILRVEYPIVQQDQVLDTLDYNDSVKRMSSLPPLRSLQDRFGMTQVIVTDPSVFRALACVTATMMNLKTSLSHENTPVIVVNGSVYPLYMDFVDDPQNLPISLKDPQTSGGESKDNNNIIPDFGEKTADKLREEMRLGPCSYLTINTNIFKDETMSREVLAHLSVITQSKDFVVDFDQMGNMVILALQERSVGRLAIWASALQKLTGSKAHMLFGKGNIVSANAYDLVMDNYLTLRGNTHFQLLGEEKPKLYSTDYYLTNMRGTRDQTIVLFERGKQERGFIPINVVKRVEFASGSGPEKMIGYKEEYNGIRSALNPMSDCRLVFIEGSAGTGKSRIIHEITSELPNAVKISVDPAGRNITGFTLVDFAAQLGEDIKARYESGRAIPQRIRLLLNFNDRSENDKLLEANRSPETISIFCEEALACLEEEFGPYTLIVDDIHHIDRLSDGHIMNLLEDVSTKKTSNSKAAGLRRPGSSYASSAQENLKITVGNSVTVSLEDEDGKPKLGFSSKEIADEYILYSPLMRRIRNNPETGEHRTIGDWGKELGNKCSTPFEMTSYLQGIQDSPEHLIVDKGTIELTPKGREKMHKSLGQEMIIYHLERMRVGRMKLSAESMRVLQTFALVGFRYSFKEYLEQFMELAFGYPAEKTRSILQELQMKGYLVTEKKVIYSGESDDEMEPLTSYRIWHENLRDIVLRHTMDDKGREEIATRVYKAAAELKLVSDDQLFSLMHYAAHNKFLNEHDFWGDYMNYANRTLKDAKRNNLYAQGYNVATMILDELDAEENTSPEQSSTMAKALTELTYGEKLPGGFKEFIINTLKAIAHHGYYVGEMEKVHEAISVMERIQEQFPDDSLGMSDLYEIGFDAAYFQYDRTALMEYFKKMQEAGVDGEKLKVYALRAAYIHRQTEECLRIIESYGDAELPIEVERLKYRIELQDIYDELVGAGIDGDAAYSGLDLTPEQTRRVWIVRTAMDKFRQKFAAASKEKEVKAKRNHPILELSLLDIEGDAAAFLGIYSHAIKSFSEIWRLSMQMEIPRQALFAAKRKGDLEIMQAVVLEHAGKMTASQKFLRSAIYTYTEEGYNVAKKMTDTMWLDLFHIQRLRAVSMYLESIVKELSASARVAPAENNNQDIKTLIEMALVDIEAIEKSDSAKDLPGEFFDKSEGDEYEDCYYVTPYISSLRYCLGKLGYESMMQTEPYKFESAGCVQAGRFYSKQFKEDKMGELNRKKIGLQKSKNYFWTEDL